MAGAMRRRTGFHRIFLRAVLVSALAAAAGNSCGGGPCGSRVVIVNVNPEDSQTDCSACGEPVLLCSQVSVESGKKQSIAMACNIANVCPGN
jgi:hypothetical protein